MNNESYSEKEAADFLGVAYITLLRKRLAGEIGFYRYGTRVVYSRLHLEDFQQRCENKPRVRRESIEAA